MVMETSALVEFLVGSDQTAQRVRASASGEVLAAPHSIDLECASTLRGLVRGHKLPAAEAERALDVLARIGIRRYGHVALLPRIWQLRDNAWPYDAAYVALAESLQADLVTVDGKFEKIPGLRCRVRNLRITS
jgi:predicted nucleic acid-binding protein